MKCEYIFVKQNWLTNVISNNNFYPSLEVQQLPKWAFVRMSRTLNNVFWPCDYFTTKSFLIVFLPIHIYILIYFASKFVFDCFTLPTDRERNQVLFESSLCLDNPEKPEEEEETSGSRSGWYETTVLPVSCIVSILFCHHLSLSLVVLLHLKLNCISYLARHVCHLDLMIKKKILFSLRFFVLIQWRYLVLGNFSGSWILHGWRPELHIAASLEDQPCQGPSCRSPPARQKTNLKRKLKFCFFYLLD